MSRALVRLGKGAFTVGMLTLSHCAAHVQATDTEPLHGAAASSDPVAEDVEVPPAKEPTVAPKAHAARPTDEPLARTLKEQREHLFRTMERELDFTPEQLASVKHIVESSPFIGQGNPKITHHPMTRAECRDIRSEAGLDAETGSAHAPCTRANMVPVYDADAGQTEKDAKVCIDQYEFPNIACEYPVVFASAREAALVCEASGKRICDAHEWEGACAGALHAPEAEYDFEEPRSAATRVHNEAREKKWAYGPSKNHALCATGSTKSPSCPGGGWGECGSNTYPSGAFPACVSPLGVFDQHGNVAEHMNLPRDPSELGSRGGHGSTEMKGSWFVFQRNDAHEDDCRWRAKDWHPSKLMSEASHSNYHLGFRCCSDVEEPSRRASAPQGATPSSG